MERQLKTFTNGSVWLKVDFCLHTKADDSFIFEGDTEEYISSYVEKLEEQKIKIAVIANHNKFDFSEYKKIVQGAKKKEIYVLPAIEISVNDSAKGLHCIVVFDPEEWLESTTDYINEFLSIAFSGKINYGTESDKLEGDLIKTIEKLNAFDKNYFIVMSHIEQEHGFYHELGDKKIKKIGKQELFRKSVLALHGVRSYDIIQELNKWMPNILPTFVEGSEPKSIEEVGLGEEIDEIQQSTYLKIGTYNFSAVKYALEDKEYRKLNVLPNKNSGHIKSISFSGGKLDGTIVDLSSSMNNFIGVRGSGKSSILEAIRYALDIELNESQNVDSEYKNNLVNSILGSGGHVTCEIVSSNGVEYRLEKTLGDKVSTIFLGNQVQEKIRASDIIRKPIYFGQRDLSQIGDSLSTEYLISKLIGSNLSDNKEEVLSKKEEVISILKQIKENESKLEKKSEYEDKKASLVNKLNAFEDSKIDKKLEKQIRYNQDANFIKRIVEYENDIMKALSKFIEAYSGGKEEFEKYESEENKEYLELIVNSLISFDGVFDDLKDISSKFEGKHKELINLQSNFEDKYKALKEEFSKIKREVNLPDIQADDFVANNKTLDEIKSQLSELEAVLDNKEELHANLTKALIELKSLWYDEFEIIEKGIKRVNESQKIIEIGASFKANKEVFRKYLTDMFEGSGLRDSNIQQISNNYKDLIGVYTDLQISNSSIKESLTENQLHDFKKLFYSQIEELLTYRVPDKFEIVYRKRSLKEHSLGQRASALIIFLLSLRDSDLIIIDQPEDDLDNKTIYRDVIRIIKELKETTQFIFATHNPNIPVLGDCEQLISSEYTADAIKIKVGSVDDRIIRNEIVSIMEGGEKAFTNRKAIYDMWKK